LVGWVFGVHAARLASSRPSASARPTAASLHDAARAALAHGIDVVALAGAAIVVAGTAASLMLARGRQPERASTPIPQPAGAG
jgi:hypothetical protein